MFVRVSLAYAYLLIFFQDAELLFEKKNSLYTRAKQHELQQKNSNKILKDFENNQNKSLSD